MIAKTSRERAVKAVASLLVLSASLYFIVVNAHLVKLTREELGKYFDIRFVLLVHMAGGATALLTGPLQFWDELRRKSRTLHRRIGMAYVLAIAVSAPCALFMSFTTARELGWPYVFSLQVWASVWMVSTFLAYRFARRKKLALHREWMIRSYLVTLAFVVSALLYRVPFIAARGTFAEVSPGLFWAAWAVPLFAVDVVLSVRRQR
jgi:uncharacterized membrane protein